MAQRCSPYTFGVVHVAFVGLLVVVALVVLVVLVVGRCILCTNCATGTHEGNPRGWGGGVVVRTSTRFGKIQLRQSTVLVLSSNSFCCSCLALNFDLHEASQTANCIWLRADGLTYRL